MAKERKPIHKVNFNGIPTVDDAFIRSLFGTDLAGLAKKIKRGEIKCGEGVRSEDAAPSV